MTGEGVPRNDAEAVRLWRLAATQGFPPAQLELGILGTAGLSGRLGDSAQRDFAEAALWLWLAVAHKPHCTGWAAEAAAKAP